MSQYLKYLAAVPYDFIVSHSIPVSNCCLFCDINISQGSALKVWWDF